MGGFFSRFQEFNLDTSEQLGFSVSLAQIEHKT